MDWRGQKGAEALTRLLLVASAAAALLASYLPADYRLMLVLYASGPALTALAAVPDWPVFSRHPLRWLNAAEAHRKPSPPQVT